MRAQAASLAAETHLALRAAHRELKSTHRESATFEGTRRESGAASVRRVGSSARKLSNATHFALRIDGKTSRPPPCKTTDRATLARILLSQRAGGEVP